MKFSCTQENFNKGLQNVAHLTGRNLTLPILNNILIEADEGIINLSSTNLEIGTKASLRGRVEEKGKITVPAKTLTDYVNLLPKERIDIILDGDVLNLKCLNYQTKIKGVAAEDFPLIPILKQESGFVIEVECIKKAINQTVFAGSPDDTRPEINGVLFNIIKEELVMVATDSFRLVENKLKIKNKDNLESKIILPLKTLYELVRILESTDSSELNIYLEENQIMFKLENLLLISRLVDGQFPDYQPIIPTEHKTKIELNKEEIVKAVKLAGLFTKTGINDVNLEFVKGRQTTVSSVNSQVGENKTILESKNKGEDNKIVFNQRYLLEGLMSLVGNKIELEMTSPANPALIKSKDDNNHIYLIMPIKQ